LQGNQVQTCPHGSHTQTTTLNNIYYSTTSIYIYSASTYVRMVQKNKKTASTCLVKQQCELLIWVSACTHGTSTNTSEIKIKWTN
jgi:hypothetical protein